MKIQANMPQHLHNVKVSGDYYGCNRVKKVTGAIKTTIR